MTDQNDRFEKTVSSWGQGGYSPGDWPDFLACCEPISFIQTTLEIDEALWGGFWQGDVLAPGYVLPALELSYLRTTRLDQSLDVDSQEAYFDRIRTALYLQPHGLWLVTLLDTTLLCAFISPWVIWMWDGAIVAVYWDQLSGEPGYQLQPIIPFRVRAADIVEVDAPALTLTDLADWTEHWAGLPFFTKLDRLILAQRLYAHLEPSAEARLVAQWLEQHR